jgi:hypothetical protein
VKNRVIAGVAVLAVVLALVGLAVVGGRDGGSGPPAVLPVLGAASAGGAASTSAAMADTKLRVAPVRYEAGKLPGLADEADAWTMAPESPDEGRVAALAKALDVDGDVTRSDNGWTVGTDARRLDVQDVAGLPWSLYESAPAPDPAPQIECFKAPCEPPAAGGSSGCAPDATCTTAVAAAPAPECPPNASCAAPPSGGAADCVATPCDDTVVGDPGTIDPGSCAADACGEPMIAQRPANLPSKDEAERIGRKAMAAVGVDLDHADVRVDDSITIWNVMADPIVGGLPTIGLTTSIGVGPDGVVQYANGWLGQPAKGDAYPLIGTAAGLERLNAEQGSTMIAAPNVRCDGCEPSEPVEPRVVRITGVRLGLQVFSTYERGATAYLVPTYLFSSAEGGDLPVVAVPDQYLGQQQADRPTDAGTPAEPSGACTGSGTATAPGGDPGPQVQVCAPGTAKAGEPVTFSLSGEGALRDDCGSPVPDWGDGTDVAVCDIGCASLPPEPTKLAKSLEHTYEKAGTYTATFHFRGCGDASGEDQASISTEVRVEG